MYAQRNSSGVAAGPMLLHSQFVNVNFSTLNKKTLIKARNI